MEKIKITKPTINSLRKELIKSGLIEVTNDISRTRDEGQSKYSYLINGYIFQNYTLASNLESMYFWMNLAKENPGCIKLAYGKFNTMEGIFRHPKYIPLVSQLTNYGIKEDQINELAKRDILFIDINKDIKNSNKPFATEFNRYGDFSSFMEERRLVLYEKSPYINELSKESIPTMCLFEQIVDSTLLSSCDKRTLKQSLIKLIKNSELLTCSDGFLIC